MWASPALSMRSRVLQIARDRARVSDSAGRCQSLLVGGSPAVFTLRALIPLA